MRKLLLSTITVLLISPVASAQVLKRLGDRAKQKVEQKIGDKVDKSIDEATDGKKKTETAQGAVKEQREGDAAGGKTEGGQPGLKSYSRFDFVPGETILYTEDFSQDAIGEFPLKWNTNGSGEVVTMEGVPGRWLKMIQGTYYESGLASRLPENYTVEFDLLTEFKDDQRVPEIEASIFQPTGPYKLAGITFRFAPNGGTYTTGTEDRVMLNSDNEKGSTHLETKSQLLSEFTRANHSTNPVHIAIWVQKERVRAWVNEVKVYDLPKGMAPTVKPERFRLALGAYGGDEANYKFYASNIKIAAAAADNRSKLVTEGRMSTTGILFDVNSDRIRPASYGVLKEIAAVLKENPGLKVRIIGHTDSDGEADDNLNLSKRRAASVRTALTTEFGIDGSRLETDGAGEGKPVADNKTPEARAQNRRVEFIKL